MQKFIIKGPSKGIKGEVDISGAKNSCLALMAASILFKNEIILKNVPFVNDVFTMKNLLTSLGSNIEINIKKRLIKIKNRKKHKLKVPYKLVSTMRAGVLTMGSLLGRYQTKKIYVAKGGGCSLGVRDINYHLEGFQTLKAYNSLNNGYVKIFSTKGLVGSFYKFPKVTVTGTANLIMASVLAKGSHVLKNISIEPEIIDLINFLNNSGANIKFLSRRVLKITGVKELINGNHNIIGDRIEAFSYLCVGAISRGTIIVRNINPIFLSNELNVLKKLGCTVKAENNSISIKSKKILKPLKINTGPYPKFATDNMPALLAVLSTVKGKSEINETIFSNRFMAAPELSRMGAIIKIKKNKAIIQGQKKLIGADCISSDLRTTFSIILGALAAKGISKVQRVYHGLRGYYNLIGKLKKVGINIKSSE